MAVNRIRGAFAVPRKGETFELRAGLVYVLGHYPPNAAYENGALTGSYKVSICLGAV